MVVRASILTMLAVMQNNFDQLIQIVHQAGWIPPQTDQMALAQVTIAA